MYRLRVRVDVPGEGRIQKSFPICPVSGPGSLNKTERKRKRMEIVAQYNSQDYLKKVEAHETGTTFKAQSILWMSNCQSRKRKPMKPVTLVNWQSYLDNHILPFLGSQPIAEVNNASMKKLVEVLVGKGVAPQAIKNICLVVKLVKANAMDENGDELYPMKWNAEFIDAPVVDARKQNTPSLVGEEVTKILAAIEAEMKTLFILDAATGLRAGELLGLEIRHFDGRSLTVEQSVWRSDAQAPKTQNAYRIVDLTRRWRSCFLSSSGTARADTFSARARESRSDRATSCAAACTRFWKNSESNGAAFMPSADSAIPICGITHPARVDFAISGLDGAART